MMDQRRHTPSAVHVDPREAPTLHTRVLWPDGMACRHQRAALRRRGLLSWVATAVLLGSGRAASPAASATRLRVVVASCADQRQPQPLWDAVLTEQPDFFVFAGDAVGQSAGGTRPAVPLAVDLSWPRHGQPEDASLGSPF